MLNTATSAEAKSKRPNEKVESHLAQFTVNGEGADGIVDPKLVVVGDDEQDHESADEAHRH